MVGDVSADVVMATSDIASGENEDAGERGDGKLSLRMKLVTPVEEGSSERFSLQSETRLAAFCCSCITRVAFIFLRVTR